MVRAIYTCVLCDEQDNQISNLSILITCGMSRPQDTSACFFFNDTATTEIYTLSLHDALPISVFRSEAERIVQFHRLLLLMNVDQEQHEKEINTLHNLGLKMGLPPAGIAQVLKVMDTYPDKIVPPQVLIDIFKAHYN